MSSRIPEPCPARRGPHDGELRFYIQGWLCDAHAPWAAKRLSRPAPGAGLPWSAVAKKTT
jgi:hypothetical protein